MSAYSVWFVLGLGISSMLFILVVFGANILLSPRNPSTEKNEPYECGMPQAGFAWNKVTLRFSTLAVLFVLFDAAAILLFGVAVALRGSPGSLIAFLPLLGFLCLGLLYAWRKGALQWHL